MKTLNPRLPKLVVTTIISILVVVVGCQDPSISSSSPEDKSMTITEQRPKSVDSSIPLDAVLKVPGRTHNSFVSIKGQVFYSFRSTPYRDRHRVDLELSTNARLAPDETGKTLWSVTGKSHDQLFVSEEGIALLEKQFNVEGAQGGMRLTLRFLISSDGIGLNEMRLEQIDEPQVEQKTD